ncbi:hypothetical protein LJC41_06790 [Desulfosarcina sp. OttesenSCG-928-G17]|nr:hypothetical protein [Desulfosarcina sp. OttesenSCG-928-G17]
MRRIDKLHLDEWIDCYNTQKTHQGKMRCGRTSMMQTLRDGKQLWIEKVVQLN